MLLWLDELNPRVRCAFGNVLVMYGVVLGYNHIITYASYLGLSRYILQMSEGGIQERDQIKIAFDTGKLVDIFWDWGISIT